MKWKTTILTLSVAAAIGCGDNNENNTGNNTTPTNNGASNNTTPTNNSMSNNGMSNNTTSSNNGMSNNTTTTNNGMSNNSTPTEVCSFTRQDADGNSIVETKVKSWYEDENWAQPVRALVEQMGSLLQSSVYLLENSWDEAGNLTSQVVDFDNDGSTDWIISFSYDEDGNQTGFAFDNDADGEPEFTQTLTFDEYGQNTGMTEDGVFEPATWTVMEAADGTPNAVAVIDWLDEGKPLHLTFDADNDGNLEYEVTFTYDSDGHQTRVEQDGALGSNDWSDIRLAADGTTDFLVEMTYDTDGNLLTHREDGFFQPAADENEDDLLEVADGTWDFERIDHEYDANGNVTTLRQDGRRGVDNRWSIRADGTFDRLLNFVWEERDGAPGTYDAASYDFDEGDDGSIDFSTAQTYDADGNLTHREVDGVIDNGNNILTPADGTAQDVADLVWYSPEQLASYERDFDGDGALDVDLKSTYNDNDQLLTFERDGDMQPELFEFGPAGPADGNIDRRVTYTYDELFRATSFLDEVADEEGTLEKAGGFEREWGDCADFEL